MKKVLFFMCSLLLAFGLMGCSDKNNSKNAKTTDKVSTDTAEQIEKKSASTLSPTKEGTILKQGESYVYGNISLQVDSVSFENKNLMDLLKKIGPEKNGSSDSFVQDHVDSNGNAIMMHTYVDNGKEITEKGPYKDCQIVVVNCTVKNDTDARSSINLYPRLFNYTGHKYTEYEYCHMENLESAQYSTDYSLDAKSQGTLTFLFATGEPLDKSKSQDLCWDVKNKPLYLGFHQMAEDLELDKGICGYGKFLQIH